jgi:hypothetical protein
MIKPENGGGALLFGEKNAPHNRRSQKTQNGYSSKKIKDMSRARMVKQAMARHGIVPIDECRNDIRILLS